MLLHACGGCRLRGPPGASRGLQGASRGLQGPPKASKAPKKLLKTKNAPTRTAKASNPGRGRNFTRDGQAGLGHPPGGGGLRSGPRLGVSAFIPIMSPRNPLMLLDMGSKYQSYLHHTYPEPAGRYLKPRIQAFPRPLLQDYRRGVAQKHQGLEAVCKGLLLWNVRAASFVDYYVESLLLGSGPQIAWQVSHHPQVIRKEHP